MERKYSGQLNAAMNQRVKTIEEDGLNILLKPIPETDEPGLLDPRLYDSMAPMFQGLKGMLVKKLAGGGKKSDKQKSAERMRKMMGGVKSIPIAEGVTVQDGTVPANGIKVPIRIYTPQESNGSLKPVFYYIHGGGFVAGSPAVVEEMCKLVVENTGCVSVSVDYRLAPENPYPAGLDDCYTVLEWIAANAASFGGDAERICIAGDSAGGNLATVCALRARDEGKAIVKLQVLFYPTVDMASMRDEAHVVKPEDYDIAPAHKSVIQPMLQMLSGASGGVSLKEYLGVTDDTHPYLSPLRGSLAGLPPCLLIFGEYDFLRFEDEAYARKLQAANVEVKVIRYAGLTHGFADQVGVTPQAEDSLEETGRFLVEQLG